MLCSLLTWPEETIPSSTKPTPTTTKLKPKVTHSYAHTHTHIHHQETSRHSYAHTHTHTHTYTTKKHQERKWGRWGTPPTSKAKTNKRFLSSPSLICSYVILLSSVGSVDFWSLENNIKDAVRRINTQKKTVLCSKLRVATER